MLDGWLEFHRQTLRWKWVGLTSEQLKMRACTPSTMSLLGLVRHVIEAELGWFRRGYAGEDIGFAYCDLDTDPDGDFDDVDEADAAADFAAYQAVLAACREAAAADSLEDTYTRKRDPLDYSLRWSMSMMIEE